VKVEPWAANHTRFGSPGTLPRTVQRSHRLTFDLLPDGLAVCRLPPDASIPRRAAQAPFVSITRTDDELSIVLPEELAEPEWECEDGWRALAVRGPLDFELVGILAAIAGCLAAAEVSLFAISTYETDIVLVKGEQIERAIAALEAAGHRVEGWGTA